MGLTERTWVGYIDLTAQIKTPDASSNLDGKRMQTNLYSLITGNTVE